MSTHLLAWTNVKEHLKCSSKSHALQRNQSNDFLYADRQWQGFEAA